MRTARFVLCFVSVPFLLRLAAVTVSAAAIEEVDLSSDSAWCLRIDGGTPRPIKVTAGGWNSDQQEPQIPSAFAKDHVTYERAITIPTSAAGNVVKVAFGGCNYGAEVFLDDRKITEHHAPQTPFEADLTGIAQPGKTYRLKVKAYDRKHYGGDVPAIPVGFDFNQGVVQDWIRRFSGSTKFAYGITGYVRLVVLPSVYVSDVFVKPSVKAQRLSCDIWITNGSGKDRALDVRTVLSSWNKKEWEYPEFPTLHVGIPAGETKKVAIADVDWRLGPGSYWWPNIPFNEDYQANLHVLNISLKEDGLPVSQHKRRFGFVEHAEGPYYYTVNGVRYASIGDSWSYGQVGEYDCWSETACYLPPEGEFKGCPETWRRYQRVGFNTVRLSSSVPTTYMLETADEAGYMLVPEGGSWGNGCDVFHRERFTGQLRDMIRVCRNHPCVSRYSMCNESIGPNGGNRGSTIKRFPPSHPDCVYRHLVDTAWETDPTRPYVYEHNRFNPYAFGHMKGLKNGHAVPMQHYLAPQPRKEDDGIRGMGEIAWMTHGMGNCARQALSLRVYDYAHFAPWSWINYWPNFLEGMSHARHPWKNNNHPDRIDNADGWGSPIVKLVQKSFHPYLLLDRDFLSENPAAPNDKSGAIEWPHDIPQYGKGQPVERRIEVFNGGLSGSRMSLRWSARWDSPTGPFALEGNTIGPFVVEPGFHCTQAVSFTPPGTDKRERKLYLILESIKDENVVFQEDAVSFIIGDRTWTKVDDGDDNVSYSPGWLPWQGNPCYQQTEHYSREVGATATFTFTGTRARFYGCRRNDLGITEIAVDGKVRTTLDLYQTTREYAKLYETDELPSGDHTLEVKVTGKKHRNSVNHYVIVDAFGFGTTASQGQNRDR